MSVVFILPGGVKLLLHGQEIVNAEESAINRKVGGSELSEFKCC